MKSEITNQKDYTYLCQNYEKLSNSFLVPINEATKEFFSEGLSVVLLGISKNSNPLMDKKSYFVTKVKITELFDIFFRLSDKAVSIILDFALGRVNRKFNFDKMSTLEAKVITSYNDFLYNAFSKVLTSPPPTVTRTNFDVINLTFLIKDDTSGECGKFIVTIPQVLLTLNNTISEGQRDYSDSFANSMINVTIKVGSTKFSLYDLKNIENDDIVVFENSDLNKFEINYNDWENIVNVKPNMGLVMPFDNNKEAYNMGADNVNLWDSIEVEIDAKFESVKITLGELKSIESGTVVDLTSIYDNQVTLSVENKPIAKGELVIINDRYGVKIKEVLAEGDSNKNTPQDTKVEEESEYDKDIPEDEYEEEYDNQEDDSSDKQEQSEDDEDDFDYSDFELEDEDI